MDSDQGWCELTAWAVADDGREWKHGNISAAFNQLIVEDAFGRVDVETEFEERQPQWRRVKGRGFLPLFPPDQEYLDAVEEEDAISNAAES